MLPFLVDYWDRLSKLHEEMRQAISGLSPAALDWRPGPGMNSLAVLAAHAAGAERYWIGQMAGNDPVNRDRSAEFQTQEMDSAALIALLDDTLAHSQGVLTRLTVDDLEASRASSLHDEAYSVGWSLLHALEHTALHSGHIQLTRQLWEQRQG